MRKELIIIYAALALLTTGCGEDTGSGKPAPESAVIPITHALGEVTVPLQPKRVAALDYSCLETFSELGIPVVAVPKGNLPGHLEQLSRDASVADVGTVKEIHFEKLYSQRPDIIFISARLQNSYEELQKIAPTVYLETDPQDFINSFNHNLRLIGRIFEKEKEVEAAIQSIQEKIAQIKRKAGEKEGTALIALYNNGKFSVYGRGSRFGIIHDVLGIKPAVEHLQVARHGQAVSHEFFLETDPDYLFIIDRGAVVAKKTAARAEIENPVIRQTKAYKNKRIIYLNPETWYLSGGGITSINAMLDEILQALEK